jgi:hypothetical protein
MDSVPEIQDVQTGWSLVQAVTIAALIEPQQTAQDESDRGFVRYHDNIFILWLTTISRMTGRARARTLMPDSPPSGANVNGSDSQEVYSSGN